jgi:hypothetical protein
MFCKLWDTVESVAITVCDPAVIFAPVYTTQSALVTSAHCSSSGQASGVGQAGGVVKPVVHTEHFPQLLQPVLVKILSN